jgi:hypothetical protein
VSTTEYLVRVRPCGQGFSASIRQLSGCAHPEVRAVLGPVSHGQGRTEPAAMLSAICSARIGDSVAFREVSRHGC